MKFLIIYFVLTTFSFANTCNHSSSNEQFDQFVNHPTQSIMNNTRFLNCGESEKLKELTYQAVKRGFACMNQIKKIGPKSTDENVRRRANEIYEIGKLMLGKFIDNSRAFNIVCADETPEDQESLFYLRDGANAFAMTCHRENHETLGIKLNKNYLSSASDREIKASIFHEVTHHGNLFHDHVRQDWVYEIQMCCFGYDEESYTDLENLETQYSCGMLLSADHNARMPRARDVVRTLETFK